MDTDLAISSRYCDLIKETPVQVERNYWPRDLSNTPKRLKPFNPHKMPRNVDGDYYFAHEEKLTN